VAEYTQLAESQNPSWREVGRSGVALEQGDADEALARANEAVRLEEGLAVAHYQLGLVQARRNSHEAAAQAFARAAELAPTMAYAHYYAAMSFQRVRNVNRMATHLERFLQLAPNAPERVAVLAVLRSIRG
jgi:tetratricopeptide (TPR) repeat protein